MEVDAHRDHDVKKSKKSKAALDFVKRSLKSAKLWHSLTSHPHVKKLVAQSIVAKMRREGRNGALAQLLITMSTQRKKRKIIEPDSPWPPRVRRRLRSKQSANCFWMTQGIACLNIDLMATILSSVDLPTKLSAMCVSRGLQEILRRSTAWDPVVVDKAICRNIFRRRGLWLIPKVFYQVSAIDIHLMDAEGTAHNFLEQSDTEDERDPNLIRQPLSELSSAWPYFENISTVMVRNISTSDIIVLLYFRCSDLKSLSFVQIQYTENRTYCLKAAMDEPPFVDCTRVKEINSSRIPPGLQNESITISEREALFLLEHPTAYKNGSEIHFTHDVNEVISSHLIRKMYKDVLDCLKERFPRSFR